MRLPLSNWRSKKQKAVKAALLAKIESLGFAVLDRRGWEGGSYASRRYYLERGDEKIGPYATLEDALEGARKHPQ